MNQQSRAMKSNLLVAPVCIGWNFPTVRRFLLLGLQLEIEPMDGSEFLHYLGMVERFYSETVASILQSLTDADTRAFRAATLWHALYGINQEPAE